MIKKRRLKSITGCQGFEVFGHFWHWSSWEMEEVDVFVTDPTTLDLDVYDLWLKGFSGWFLLMFVFNGLN